ncbi:MAG TPA: discoidin domain-containing protein, partial [Solirubrobacteraceae bacterium]|nr:discoidin domain-containing protein [Solirubrobacteraceae bacterium]
LVVFPREHGPPPAHLVSSQLPVEDLHGLRATVRADTPGRYTLIGARGSMRYRGIVDVRDELAAVPLGGDWALQIGDRTETRPLGSWTDVEPAFSGTASYEREVDLDAATLAGRRWTLDLGDVRDVAEVTVNGRELPARLWAPYALDVTGALLPGSNTIAVRVTNTGANARGEPLASGLLGPVALRPSRRLAVELERVSGERLLEIEADPLALAPGQERTMAVRVRDHSGRSGDVKLSVAGEGVEATPSTATVRLGRDGEGTAEIAVRAPGDAPVPGQAAVVVTAGETRERLPVRLAAVTRLGSASASSSYPGRGPELAIDGITDSTLWDQGQGWNDGTSDAYPDVLTVAFDGTAPVGRVRVHTLDSAQYPASAFGIADFDVQVRVDGEWRTVGALRSNDRGLVEVAFEPVEADGVRLVIHAARASYSRVIELEALR